MDEYDYICCVFPSPSSPAFLLLSGHICVYASIVSVNERKYEIFAFLKLPYFI